MEFMVPPQRWRGRGVLQLPRAGFLSSHSTESAWSLRRQEDFSVQSISSPLLKSLASESSCEELMGIWPHMPLEIKYSLFSANMYVLLSESAKHVDKSLLCDNRKCSFYLKYLGELLTI